MGSNVIISEEYEKKILEDCFIIVNMTDHNTMLHHAVFHLDLFCLPKYLCMVFWYTQGYVISSSSLENMYLQFPTYLESKKYVHIQLLLTLSKYSG